MIKNPVNLSQTAALILVALVLGGGSVEAITEQDALNEPLVWVYTPPNAPDIHVSIHSPYPSDQGGLSQDQLNQVIAMLNQLPANHLRGVKNIAFAPLNPLSSFLNHVVGTMQGGDTFPDGNIIMDSTPLSPLVQSMGMGTCGFAANTTSAGCWQDGLLHELGHAFEYSLPASVDQPWVALHNASKGRPDFVSDYAYDQKDTPQLPHLAEEEDFAETHRAYTTDTHYFLTMAVTNASQGYSDLLAKFFFMAGQFANGDGTINFYGPDNSTNTFYAVHPMPYQKTADTFQLDGYTFALSGSNITTITDASGNVLASNLSVPIPPYWPVVNTTAVPPSNPNPAPTPPPRNPKLPNPEISGGTDSSAGSIETVVGGGPDNYVPLTAARANSQLRDLQVNGIRAGDSGGAAVHGGTAVRIRSLGSSSLPSIIVDPPSSSANVIELP